MGNTWFFNISFIRDYIWALQKKQTYTLMDTISSLSSGITNILKDSMGIILIIFIPYFRKGNCFI